MQSCGPGALKCSLDSQENSLCFSVCQIKMQLVASQKSPATCYLTVYSSLFEFSNSKEGAGIAHIPWERRDIIIFPLKLKMCSLS